MSVEKKNHDIEKQDTIAKLKKKIQNQASLAHIHRPDA
jgi:hypothetical protein